MKSLVVVNPPSIYHGCSTRKTFWEEKFTGKKVMFQSVNMKNCGSRKVKKHKEIKGSYKIVTLNVSEKFYSLKKMKTISSQSKIKLGRSGRGVGNRSGFQDQSKVTKIKKARYVIRNVSMKKISNIIKEFEKIGKVSYMKRIPKHEPTSSYYHLVRCIADYMMRSDEHNRHVHSIYAEDTAPSLNVIVTDEDKSK